MPSTKVLQEIMELPKCEDESGCRWIKADDVYRAIDNHIKEERENGQDRATDKAIKTTLFRRIQNRPVDSILAVNPDMG